MKDSDSNPALIQTPIQHIIRHLKLAVHMKKQAFIQALLSTAAFPQRFGFFTVCLVQWLRGVAPW